MGNSVSLSKLKAPAPAPAQMDPPLNPSLQLPEEIIEEILARLPVRSLLRFKSVSKSWRRLIGSDRFIKLHLQKSRDDKTFSHWRVIINYEESSTDRSLIEYPKNNNLPIIGSIVDICNGVLCFRNESGSFILFNPATRVFNQLPQLYKATDTCGFGWDETSDAYKVFVVVSDQFNNLSGRIYSTKTKSWKTVEHGVPPNSECRPTGKFACGKIHWLVKSGRDTRIETFDLKREVFGVMELPFGPVSRYAWLTEYSYGFLAVRSNEKENAFDIWIMKEYGVKESWVKESWIEPQESITSLQESHSYYKSYSFCESLVSPVSDEHRRDKAITLLCKFSKFIEELKHKKICIACFSSSYS